jgi:hypothetical protein
MKLLTNPNGGDGQPRPGVMIPIPQYPLYSASLAEYNIDQVIKVITENIKSNQVGRFFLLFVGLVIT